MYIPIETQIKFTQDELNTLEANAAAANHILAAEIRTAVLIKRAVLRSLANYGSIRGSPVTRGTNP